MFNRAACLASESESAVTKTEWIYEERKTQEPLNMTWAGKQSEEPRSFQSPETYLLLTFPFIERASSDRCIAGEMPTYRYRSAQPGQLPVCRPLAQNASFLAFHTANLYSWLLAQNLVSVLRRTGSADSAEPSRSSCVERPGCSKAAMWSPFFSSSALSPLRRAFGRRLLQRRTP